MVDSRITLTSYNTYVVNQNLLITSLKLEVARRRSAVCPYACIHSPKFQILEIEILLSFTSSSVVKIEVITARDPKSDDTITVILVARNLHLSML